MENCINPDSCEQECTNGKCELRDIEDFVVSMENNDEHAEEHVDNSEIQTEIETNVEEPEKNNQQIMEDITTNQVYL